MGSSQGPQVAHLKGTDMLNIQRFHINLSVGSKVNKYPAKQHARKVASKLSASRGLIFLIGKPTEFLDDSDQALPFRQRRYFYYLYVPDPDLRQIIYMGPTISIGEALDRYDIDNARHVGSLETDINVWLRLRDADSQIFILHPDHRPPFRHEIKSLIPAMDAARSVRDRPPISHGDIFETKSLLPAMNAARGVKDSYEIDMIRKANIVSGLAHTAILEKIGQMTNESDIAGLFLETCMTHGAPEQAYGIIAASGENGATLHYMKNNEDFGNRLSVCLDAGAEYECYASDVTRTFPISSTGEWPTTETRDIYSAVERMQEECIRMIKPGVRFRDVHAHASLVAVEELLKLGIFKESYSVDEIIASGAVSTFFPHGLGHHVGLEVHDVSEQPVMAATDHMSPSPRARGFLLQPASMMSAALLEPNMIVTVEPGIYFNRLALKNAQTLPIAQYIDFDVVERYMPIGGVRIEDDILVTTDGYENLTTAPKGDAALDIIRKSSLQSRRS